MWRWQGRNIKKAIIWARALSPGAPQYRGRVKALTLTVFMIVIIPIKIAVFCWMPV
jgi:hypothetical protein